MLKFVNGSPRSFMSSLVLGAMLYLLGRPEALVRRGSGRDTGHVEAVPRAHVIAAQGRFRLKAIALLRERLGGRRANFS
jgi:hypothetical protein